MSTPRWRMLRLASPLAGLLALWSCTDQPSTAPDNNIGNIVVGAVEYTMSGGFVGGIHTRLSIDPLGHVVLLSTNPPMEGTLTTAEKFALAGYGMKIWGQPDSLYGGCADDFTFVIVWRDGMGTKRIRADGCALSLYSGAKPYPVLNGLIALLDSIASRVFHEEAPWRGMQAAFAINDSSYDLDSPIVVSCTLTNPTDKPRRLYFLHASQLWFSVSKENFSGFYYSYPQSAAEPWAYPDNTEPSTITLNPGEQRVLTYSWDHTFITSKGIPDTLGVGTYHLRLGLLAGDFAIRDFTFDVYDSKIPLKGDIIPDYAGGDASSSRYSFQLRATNWTSSAVTLHFISSQRLAVELWDLDFDPPRTIVYTSPIQPPSTSETQVIAPGESVVYLAVVDKSSIAPGYFWSLAKVRLLCTDFSFEREGQLQIFR